MRLSHVEQRLDLGERREQTPVSLPKAPRTSAPPRYTLPDIEERRSDE
jgi:hypothetical protein